MSRLLIVAAKNVSVNSEKIALGAAWLLTTATGLIETYIWKPASAVWFLFVIYHVALFLELYWIYTLKQLSWKVTRKKILTVTSSLFGAVLLLFVATGVATYSPYIFFWMPQAIMALLFAATLLSIIKFASRLGIISKQIAEFLETKINQSTQKLKTDEPVSNQEVVTPVVEQENNPSESNQSTN
ncbi:hypothetical protein [Xanthocytophaga flava]|uniref:hypothetical protein n=1 Tax=Xanthocytophaga flava TaxID=3048013 RepID=UPI0028D6CF33|nr:hypothetical protein [Xanthocytophaga flavus]MDJ1472836.1 hypothetical protein [Xanthocytophaga flavus]